MNVVQKLATKICRTQRAMPSTELCLKISDESNNANAKK
jgi:hypothetical protein